MLSWLIPFNTSIKKKRIFGLLVFAILLTLFLLFNRIPKFDIVEEDLGHVSSPTMECFQGFCIQAGADTTLLSRWWEFSITYLGLVSIGMAFAFLVAGLTEAFIFPNSSAKGFSLRGFKGTLRGLIVGSPLSLCSACIVPISNAFSKKGSSVESTVSIVLGSSTMNLPALIMVTMVFAPLLSSSRIVLSLLGVLIISPLVGFIYGKSREEEHSHESKELLLNSENFDMSWKDSILEGCNIWLRSSFKFFIRLGPVMVLAGFASGLAIQWLSPDTVSKFLGNNILGILVATSLGIMINVPLMFEIPLVAALILLGMGPAPAGTLLFVAAAGGPITFWGLYKVLPKRAVIAFIASTWMVGLLGGAGILFYNNVLHSKIFDSSNQILINFPVNSEPVTAFTDQAENILSDGFELWNDRPGIAIFDYDRDNDLDIYFTSESGKSNFFYENNGLGIFKNIALENGTSLIDQNSTGVVACDINNDGYQDLYVGAWGDPKDKLDFRSVEVEQGNEDALLLNNGKGQFINITNSAFGEDVNIRSAIGIACADVDRDGWVDFYVGNLAAQDFRTFDSANHPGHYNRLYINNGDLTFREISESAGVRGEQIRMRDFDGNPVLFQDSVTGEYFEGYDPNFVDDLGNRIGDPTGQTHAVMFYDYDDDGDVDLWVANDSDRLILYRNDSKDGLIKFTSVEELMEIDEIGSWMGFAIGDYNGDADLDLFITNVGFHPLRYPYKTKVSPLCEYHSQFEGATCFHFLLDNDVDESLGEFVELRPTKFKNVSAETKVLPSPWMPSEALIENSLDKSHEMPKGLDAYDFGFGTTFFDFDNDTDQDLYWLGSAFRGEGPGGQVFPSAGRMLRNIGDGQFEDITVRAKMLDISRVTYPDFVTESEIKKDKMALRIKRIDVTKHENGKGVAHGDLNGDGYLDIVATNSSGPIFVGPYDSSIGTAPTKDFSGPIFVWMNGGGNNNWININLVGGMKINGKGTNADGIGARVYVITQDANDMNKKITQVQEVRAGSSYLSMDSIGLEFGLGKSEIIDDIIILWPSGVKQNLKEIEVNQTIEIIESNN